MNPRELLALLTCRVQRFHPAPGGIPNLTAEDIAHALGLVKNANARLYARVKFAGDMGAADSLACAIRRHIMICKLDNGWRIPRLGFLLDLSRLMVIEAVDPLTCAMCNGTKDGLTETGSVVVCGACRGTGKRRIDDTDRAQLVGISKSSWSDPWGERYRVVQIDTVDKWEDIAVAALKKRLRA